MATVAYFATTVGNKPDRQAIDLGNVKTGVRDVPDAGGSVKLGEGVIASLTVQNLFVNQDGSTNTETVVVTDKAARSGLELAPGQSTPVIAAENLNDIWLLTR